MSKYIIPVDIDQFSMVRHICACDLKNNGISFIYNKIGFIKKAIPKEIFNLVQLKSLSLTGILDEFMPNSIINLRNLNTLYMWDNKVNNLSIIMKMDKIIYISVNKPKEYYYPHNLKNKMGKHVDLM